MQQRIIDIDEAIEKIAEDIANQKGNKFSKIFDYEVAEALEISSAALATTKKRYELPLKYIINYCIKNNKSLDDFLITDQ